MSGEETFCFFGTWRPEWGLNPRSLWTATFQASPRLEGNNSAAQMSNPHSSTQQTWGVGPTLVYCWANVVDGGPTVIQRWANVSCLLGRPSRYTLDDTALLIADRSPFVSVTPFTHHPRICSLFSSGLPVTDRLSYFIRPSVWIVSPITVAVDLSLLAPCRNIPLTHRHFLYKRRVLWHK